MIRIVFYKLKTFAKLRKHYLGPGICNVVDAFVPAAVLNPVQEGTLQGTTGADVLRWSADTVRKYQLCAAQVEGLRAAWLG